MAETISSTTLAAAINSTTVKVNLASATGVAKDVLLHAGGETMQVRSVTGTVARVQRGWAGSRAVAHPTGVKCWVGASKEFKNRDPQGEIAGGSADVDFLPWINTFTGRIFSLDNNNRWVQVGSANAGENAGNAGSFEYTAAGAIALEPGLHMLNGGGVIAMTLAVPTPEMDGMELCIFAEDASAHTVTFTPGFNGGTTSRDVGTFGGAIADRFTVRAHDGIWWTTGVNVNVTLG